MSESGVHERETPQAGTLSLRTLLVKCHSNTQPQQNSLIAVTLRPGSKPSVLVLPHFTINKTDHRIHLLLGCSLYANYGI